MIQCPYCRSQEKNKQGRLPSGKQRYKCKSCGRKYIAEYEPPKVIHSYTEDGKMLRCPKCKSTHVVKHGVYKGKNKTTQRYMCSSCKYDFNAVSHIPFKKVNTEIKCKYCGSMNIVKAGKTKADNRIFICRECGRKFVPASKVCLSPTKPSDKELVTPQQLKQIIMYKLMKLNMREISKSIGVSLSICNRLFKQWATRNGYYYNKKEKRWLKDDNLLHI